MKNYKRLSLLLIALLIATVFTGCNKEEKDLLNAFDKNQEILNVESTSDMEFNLVATGLDEESQVMFDGFVNQINDMKLSINQKSVTNKDQTIAKSQIDANIQLTDMSFDSSIWMDMDMSGETPVMKEIFKVPSMLMGMIPGAAAKEYIILDFDTINETIANMEEDMPEPVNVNDTMKIAMKFQKRFKEAFVDYQKNYDSDLSVVTKLDDKTVDGKKIKYYQVEFDNHSFKEFIKYTTISMLQDENIIPLFKEYMTELFSASGEEMPEELSLTGDITKMVQKTKEFFEKIEELTILGEDGIVITYGINEDGYFVSEEGKLDFLIDTKEFMALASDSIEEDKSLMKEKEVLKEMPTPVLNLSVSYVTKINSINKDLKITMPTTTDENSIDYMELMETMISKSQQDPVLMVFVEDEFIKFTNEPILVDNRYLISSRDMAEAFGANISWNVDTKEINIAKDDNQLIFNANNKQLSVNGEVKTLNPSIVIIDGVSFIPIRAVSENLGYTVEWDQNIKMVTISK